MIASPARRRAVLVVLVLVIVACLGAVTLVVTTRSAGDGLSERLRSLKNDEVPTSARSKEREEMLAVAKEFVTRYYTYGPDMLDDAGHLPEYASLVELMTSKFGGIFAENVELVEGTVAEVDAGSSAEVHAVGIASQDSDSAQVLVGGTLQLSASYSTGEEPPPGEDPEEPVEVTSDPQSVRLEVFLVKIDGEWLVDDFDDVDDGQPPFSQPGSQSGQTPGELPTSPTEPSATDGGEGDE